MNYYLDTNICIYFLKGLNKKIADKMKTVSPGKIKIPSIVKAELLHGARKSSIVEENLNKINKFLEPYDVVEFGDEASVFYSIIRSGLEKAGEPIGPNDLIIASTVMAAGGILVTNNIREFSRVEGLVIENWTV